ncbi:MAG: LTA synthase family protein [Bacteroidales bacterium]
MKRYIISLIYLIALHLSGLFVFSLFRLFLFLENFGSLQPESAKQILLPARAFLHGVWFDNVTACYIMVAPLAIASVCAIFHYYGARLYRGLTRFILIFYLIAFGLSAANIPYFRYFFKNINSSVFNWIEYGSTTFGMMVQEISYWIAIGVFIVVSALYIRYVWKGFDFYQQKMDAAPRSEKPILIQSSAVLALSVIMIGGCLFGIRGRRGYNPIKVSAAYYCDDPFLNQLGLNAAYNLLVTTLDDSRSENRPLQLIEEKRALSNVAGYLNIKRNAEDSFIRPVITSEKPNRKNVVMILMESMSADLIGAYKGEKSLTPFLDSLYHQSVSFKHIYSAGIHTNHGLYSTLYSFPTILKRNAMKGSDIPNYTGLPTILNENGYHNLFFMTHEAQYDNMNAFLRTNGYQEIYSEENYPEEEIVNSFGVPDDYLFEYALPVINAQAEKHQPFFATLLTISNHPPYIVPEWFNGKSKEKEDLIVEYADECIRRFMNEARKQPWFKNTLFVFVGDHGKMIGTPETEMPDSYNHVPLMFYSADTAPKEINGLGGQIDIAPTILGMLNISYKKHNLGIDLFKTERECIFYTADNMIGCRDKEHLFIYAPADQMEFNYHIDSAGYVLADKRVENNRFEYLKEYSFSMLQTTEYLVRKKLTTL